MDDYKNYLVGANIYHLFLGNYVTCHMTRSKDIGTCLIHVNEYLLRAIHIRDQVHLDACLLSDRGNASFSYVDNTNIASNICKAK